MSDKIRDARSPNGSYSTIAMGPREGWWMAWSHSTDVKGMINPGWLETREQAEARLRELIDAFGGCGVVCQSVSVEQHHHDECDEK